MNRFSDGRIWPSKVRGLCFCFCLLFFFFAVNRADSRILRTLWIVDQL